MEEVKPLAIITGASRGIGLATAERFSAAGFEVWNLSRTPCPLKTVVHHACDLGDAKQVEKIMGGWKLASYSSICLIHNAAMLRHDTYATLGEIEFMEVLRLNVLAPQLLNRRIIPQMPPGSSVIFIGSTQSESAGPDRLSYITSKHALAGLMKATAQDLSGKPIHTCLIAPGFTDTPMLREAIGGTPQDIARAQAATLAGRLVTPKEIAELIFFASGNPAINGAVLHANLGQKTV